MIVTPRNWRWPQIRSVLESLSDRAVLLQCYFVPPSADSVAPDRPEPESPTSELELVTAWRTGAWPQHGGDMFESWIDARPASYSAGLLALSRGINGHGPDPEEFSQLQSAFPQHRHWNQWLGYAFATPDERTRLRQVARDQRLWGGRLSAVYPDLGIPYARPVEPEQEPLRRLFEDGGEGTSTLRPRRGHPPHEQRDIRSSAGWVSPFAAGPRTPTGGCIVAARVGTRTASVRRLRATARS